MTNYRAILRLKSLGFNHSQIAASTESSRPTVITVLQKAAELGHTWQTAFELSDNELARLLFPQSDGQPSYKMPEYEYVHREMAKSGVTLQLLWFEYCDGCREDGSIPYQLTQFKKYYRDFVVKTKATMHIDRKPGEIMEVDWAGQTAEIIDTDTGEPITAYHADRHLDKAMIARLATCTYVQECHNLILLGATGSGKTYLATAFGMAASRSFYTVKYVRLPELLGELAIAWGEGNYRKVIKAYKQVKLLILDEWLLYPLKETEARDLLEIVEGRYKKASTIFCSQFEVGGWHPKIGEPTLADAIGDRIVHDSYTIVIGGEDSMRKRKGIAEA